MPIIPPAGTPLPQALGTTASPTFVGTNLTGQAFGASVSQFYLGKVNDGWAHLAFDYTSLAAFGAVLTGNLTLGSFPALCVLKNCYIWIITPGAGTTTLTFSIGRTGATYVDYLAVCNAMAAANTIYGKVAGERGANLTGYDLPNAAAATTVTLQAIATGSNLNTLTAGSWHVFVEIAAL